MCIITLSVLKQCRHELATIDFCKLAGCDVPKNLNEAAVESGEEPLPRIACTPSLGWTIYETPNVRVLGMKGRHRADLLLGTGNLQVVQGVVGKE